MSSTAVETKSCARCAAEKPLEDFCLIRGGKYRHSYCQGCRRRLSREQYAKNRETHLADQSRRYWADPETSRKRNRARRTAEAEKRYHLRKYGLTLAQFNDLMIAQGGLCAVCAEPAEGSALAVDHDHKTGLVRGLLCRKCNVGLGLLRDSPALLRAAVHYIEEPPAVKVLEV